MRSEPPSFVARIPPMVGALRPERIESEALAMLGEGARERGDSASGLDGGGHIAPDMLEDAVEPRSRENQIGAARRISPAHFRAAAAGNDSQPGAIGGGENVRQLFR